MKAKLLWLAVVLLASTGASLGEICGPNFCNDIVCQPDVESNCKGVFLKKGGLCQCCDACYDIIEPGQACEPLDYSDPPAGLCKHGFVCLWNKCRPYMDG